MPHVQYFGSEAFRASARKYGLDPRSFRMTPLSLDDNRPSALETEGAAAATLAALGAHVIAVEAARINPRLGGALLADLVGRVQGGLGDGADYALTQHYVDVFVRLLVVMNQAEAAAVEDHATVLLSFVGECQAQCRTLREEVFALLQRSEFLDADLVDMPVASQRQYDRMRTVRDLREVGARVFASRIVLVWLRGD